MNWFFQNLSFFTEQQKSKMLSVVTQDAFDKIDASIQKDIIYLFLQITETTSDQTKATLADCLIQSVLFTEDINIYRVFEGEDFIFEPVIQGKNLESIATDKTLVLRENISGTQININIPDWITNVTQETIDGTQVDVLATKAEVVDLSLGGGMFYKIRIQLERTDSNGLPTGDATANVGSAYFIVGNNIDTD